MNRELQIKSAVGKDVFNRKEERLDKYRKFTRAAVSESYYMQCIKTCYTDYSDSLSKSEKICLAKCIDRVYDYFSAVGDQVDPYKNKL